MAQKYGIPSIRKNDRPPFTKRQSDKTTKSTARESLYPHARAVPSEKTPVFRAPFRTICRPSGTFPFTLHPSQTRLAPKPSRHVSPNPETPVKCHSVFVDGNTSTRRKKPRKTPFSLVFHAPENRFAARNFRLC